MGGHESQLPVLSGVDRGGLTALERDGLRYRIDQARRQQTGKTLVRRKIEKAQRAQDAAELVTVLIPATRATNDHCGFCGAPTTTDVCPAHADLIDGGLNPEKNYDRGYRPNPGTDAGRQPQKETV